MKILYDDQTFRLQNVGGISRYFYELIKGCHNHSDLSVEASILFSENYFLKNSMLFDNRSFLPNVNFKGKTRITFFLNKIYSKRKVRKGDFNIFHPTYYDVYFLNSLKNKPYVLTVHDMIHEKFGELFDKNDNTAIKKRLLIQNAAKIIAISNNTKKDLLEYFKIEEEKIEVIYHGVSTLQVSGLESIIDPLVTNKYLLYVGGRNTYKNFQTFILSISEYLLQKESLKVICVGGGFFSSSEINLFERLRISKYIHHIAATDAKLMSLYKNACAFVFPSLYEGFGFPILEAFSYGCPVVCSNTSSFPEVAGDAALYFDPRDFNSILNAVQLVVSNNEVRENLIRNGKQRVKLFTWENCVNKTVQLYKSI